MPGRDPLFVWYAKNDEILTMEERLFIISRLNFEPEVMVEESKTYWFKITNEIKRNRPKPIKEKPPAEVSEEHINSFRRWRKGESYACVFNSEDRHRISNLNSY